MSGADDADAMPPFVDPKLSGQLVFNQLAVGYSIWTGGIGAQILTQQVHLDRPNVWLVGVLGSIPIIALGRAIEKSDASLFVDLNLSTNQLVRRLFGDTVQPVVALVVSLALCGLTGVVEEVIFRGGILPSLAQYAVDQQIAGSLAEGIRFGAVASTVLFAVGHLNFFGGLRNLVSSESVVLLTLQLLVGGTFAALYVLTGSLGVAIVAHFLYDLYTLYGTHLAVTDQIAYSEQPLPPLPEQSLTSMKWRMSKGKGFVDESRKAFLLMDTNRDEQISASELRMGISAMGLQLAEPKLRAAFANADADGSGEIDFVREYHDPRPYVHAGRATHALHALTRRTSVRSLAIAHRTSSWSMWAKRAARPRKRSRARCSECVREVLGFLVP